MNNNWDVCVVGGGHAGCEAALAASRMGLKTLMFVLNADSIAMMPCNPNIGGSSKGHLVKEIDALGGEMGKNIDKTFIQSRMLNLGKGPAVHSLRAQADKWAYSREMKRTLENSENLDIRQGEVCELVFEDMDKRRIKGVVSETGAIYYCSSVILALGTYLRAKCLYGEVIVESGPNGLKTSRGLYGFLEAQGISLLRFKTGTPARIDSRSLDFSAMERQDGDKKLVPFSFENNPDLIARTQTPCYLTYTNENTHEIIRSNLHRSPMYSGVIEGTGTRYCPSIEDKVVRFADKERHQIFIEPEGECTNEMYVSGMSTSMPEDVQISMYRTVKGLENCRFIRSGYAIEYDCLDATQLKLSLEFKDIDGLFSAGQFNGSSGYEEAAAQGIVAGINAAFYVKKQEPLIIDRSEAYIGVLIDDLVVKGTKEPYRMLTSRSEYRLFLRQDNADMRLTEHGYSVGLISEERYSKFLRKKELIKNEIQRVQNVIIPPSDAINSFLESYSSSPITTGIRLSELIKRPELSYHTLSEFDSNRPEFEFYDVPEAVNIEIKYKGYIDRALLQIEQFKKAESIKLSPDIDYNAIDGLRLEARQKLSRMKPENLGVASRITGVSPADISVLMISLKKMRKL